MELVLITRAIYPLHGYGGMERHCYDWTMAMAEAGHIVHIITTPPIEPSWLPEFPSKVHFYFLPGKSARSVIQRITQYPLWVRRVRNFLLRFLNDAQINAIYAQGLGAAACINFQIPVVYNPHGMEEFKNSGLKYLAYAGLRNLSRQAAQSSTHVVATDQALIEEIISYLKVPLDKIVLIPNAVMPEKTPSQEVIFALMSRLGLEKTDPLFMTAGRLESNKGFDVLLKALSLSSNLPPTWKLVIAGTGSQIDNLEKLRNRLGLEDRVVFTEFLLEDELTSLYEISDLFLNPTLYEGSSLVTLEAMRQGLPIVATKTGGLPDKVDPARNGWLVAPGDPRALASGIEDAIKRRDEWQEMGRNSAMMVREKYSWPKVTPRFLALFENPSYF